ncbi:MAG: serine/threonine-protein kinase, partial [Pseudomonadota bacterium]
MGNAQLREDPQDEQVFADELAAGSTLMHGQYTIESFLNAGGFGITYSARDSLDRRVVIKECFPGAFCRRSTALVTARSRAHQSELASIVRLFVQEARSLAKLDHPNIVGVHQVFEENNTAYMALDFVDGRDLLDVIESGRNPLTPDDVEAVLRKLLDAIRFVHDQGILHRDISPDNILLDQNNQPVLIDFGAAREQATKQSRVLSALRVVKDGYSPQEFYVAGSDQGPYSDLFALGASFYHLITGETPPNSQARLAAVATGSPDPYRPLAGRLPTYRKTFLEALDQSLAILPKDRIASASAWIDVLDGKVDGPKAKPAAAVKEAPKAQAAQPKSKKGLMLATVA